MASTIKSNTVTNATASTLTLGESGTTVTLACGATQSGFGRTGTVDWCTTAKTSPLTAVSGKGYFINTTSGAITMNLPSSHHFRISVVMNYHPLGVPDGEVRTFLPKCHQEAYDGSFFQVNLLFLGARFHP